MNVTGDFWIIVALLGLGTFGLRFSFLGLMGARSFPPWAMRLLRYVPVAVLPGLVAPLVLWPEATGGTPDPARLGAAAVVLLVGAVTRNVLGSIIAGMATLYLLLALV